MLWPKFHKLHTYIASLEVVCRGSETQQVTENLNWKIQLN